MPGFTVIEGRLSENYNHFKEYKFMSCQATDTRLMGVVALKITWQGIEKSRSRYYQVIHLDYSEYGIDEYLEFDCTPGTDDYASNKEEMNYYWNHFTGVMGGDVLEIRPEVMLRLIELALPLTSDKIDREYDTQENSEFRYHAAHRLELMKEALAQSGITSEPCSPRAATSAVSRHKLATCETINYFIMRVIDHDYDAAALLTTLDRSALENCMLAEPGIQTLIRSSIKRSNMKADPPADGQSHPYRCRITTLGRKGYYHATFVIYLDGDYRTRDSRVTQIEEGSLIRLSDYESAIQVVQKEYITVFQCPDNILEGFNGKYISLLSHVDPVAVPNGWLYTVYKKDNSHVNRAEYRLGDDVFGYALLTIGGELILMSNDVNNISSLDNSVVFSFYSPYLVVKGRYLLEKTPVFHTICHTPGAYFEDLIDTSDND